jgi:phosphohistidine phosphatase SixA
VKPDAVLTSPWLRTAQTAEIFCEVFGYPAKKIISTNTLKGTSAPPDLLRELQSMKAEVVFCFGHEPHLHQVIGHILHTHTKITEVKKAGIALLDLERISPPHGRLLALYPPSTLRLLGKLK